MVFASPKTLGDRVLPLLPPTSACQRVSVSACQAIHSPRTVTRSPTSQNQSRQHQRHHSSTPIALVPSSQRRIRPSTPSHALLARAHDFRSIVTLRDSRPRLARSLVSPRYPYCKAFSELLAMRLRGGTHTRHWKRVGGWIRRLS